MMTAITTGSPRNHSRCQGCDGSRPLTLADRERMHGRPFRLWDNTRDGLSCSCARCLADLPLGFEALFHVCEDELPAVKAGDVVRYHGSFGEFRGTVWEVTAISGRGRLRLFDMDRALSNVHRGSVTVVGRKQGRGGGLR